MQTQTRISFENTIKKTNEKLNVSLNREIVIDKLSTDQSKMYSVKLHYKNLSNIDLLNVKNWKRKLTDSTKADAYRLYIICQKLRNILTT